ncbi:MAG: amidophosphoribosyltransferase [Christensenellales bacterium]|jgi:amidophosphoribosyltransferase
MSYYNDIKPLDDRMGEECGVVGILGGANVAEAAYYGLYALQHRGQQSAGIAVSSGKSIRYVKDMGLVSDVFQEDGLKALGQAVMALGHVRYSPYKTNNVVNSQPLVVRYQYGEIAVANNGTIVNQGRIRRKLEKQGALFQTDMNSEIIAHLIARNNDGSLVEAIGRAMNVLKGAYSFVVMNGDAVVGARDPGGFRPLCIGKRQDGYVLASESCALDAIGAEFMRDVRPGEIVSLDKDGLHSFDSGIARRDSLCIFEFVYFARPDSAIDGISVFEARRRAGRLLAKEAPVDVDMVVGVPDSALAAAMGYAEEAGLAYGDGLTKNRYVPRTFNQSKQVLREEAVDIKLNALKDNIAGKRLVLVDDSIVRGTTSKRIVDLLRGAGAKEIHLRITSPELRFPCPYGIDIVASKQLIAACHDTEEICTMLGADSLAYLTQEDLKVSVCSDKGYCMGCFDGHYPIGVK